MREKLYYDSERLEIGFHGFKFYYTVVAVINLILFQAHFIFIFSQTQLAAFHTE